MNLFLNIAQASCIIQMLIFFFCYLFTYNIDFLIFFIGLFLNNRLNYILKYNFFSVIFGKTDIPFLGKGIRPSGAKNCCWFKSCKPKYPKYPKSYGMPSGHSQSIAFFSSLGVLFLLNNVNNSYSKKIISIIGSFIFICSMLFVMYSRTLFKCHTIKQTIMGSIIGIIMAYGLFKNKNKIKKKFKKYKNYELYLFLISSFLLFYIIYHR